MAEAIDHTRDAGGGRPLFFRMQYEWDQDHRTRRTP